MMGSLNYLGKDNYYRIDLPQLTTKNSKHKFVLRYDPGCYFAFSTTTKTISIKYDVHYRTTNQAYQPIKWGAEMQLFGKLNGRWQILNHWNANLVAAGGLKCDDVLSHEASLTLKFNLYGRQYSEFQLCLPGQGAVKSLEIETDTPIEYKYVKPSLAICGSSVACCNANLSSHGICPTLYRTKNLNVINAAISGDHSFNCPELMQELDKTKLPILVMDILHIDDNTLDTYMKKNFSWYPISPAIKDHEVCNFKRYNLALANIDGEGHLDFTHLNALGIHQYIQQLIERKII